MIMIVMTFTVVASPTSSSSSRDGGGGRGREMGANRSFARCLNAPTPTTPTTTGCAPHLIKNFVLDVFLFCVVFCPCGGRGMCLLILLRKSHPKKLKLATSKRKKRRLLISRSG